MPGNEMLDQWNVWLANAESMKSWVNEMSGQCNIGSMKCQVDKMPGQ
jgi:hypothetical protein